MIPRRFVFVTAIKCLESPGVAHAEHDHLRDLIQVSVPIRASVKLLRPLLERRG